MIKIIYSMFSIFSFLILFSFYLFFCLLNWSVKLIPPTDTAFLSVQDDLCDYMIGLVEDDEAALISGEVWSAFTVILHY